MPSLLSLPLELREYIIAYALSSSSPPIDPANPQGTKEYLDLAYTSRIGGEGLRYADRKHQTSPYGLLGTNRQLHNETVHALHRIKAQEGCKYALDMVMADEALIFASWTNVPPLMREIDVLAITISIHGTSDCPLLHNGFMDNENGSTGPAIWRLYSVLERFFRCGAAESRSTNEDRRLSVKMIDINILNPTGKGVLMAPADVGLDRICEYRAVTPPHTHLMHPEALAKFMYVWVEGILRLCDLRYAAPGSPIAKYGKMFLERVGMMKMRVDGVEKRVIDVLEWVKELKEKEEQMKREERELAEFEASSRAELGAWTELEPVLEVTEEEELQAVAEDMRARDSDLETTVMSAGIIADHGVVEVAHTEEARSAQLLAKSVEAEVSPGNILLPEDAESQDDRGLLPFELIVEAI
jgi:hypothetical protein